MKANKILILEAQWTHNQGSTATLYNNFIRGRAVQLRTDILSREHYATSILDFVRLPENQVGPNLLILSAHGHYDSKTQTSTLSAVDGLLDIKRDMANLAGHLQRTVVLLDACNIAQDLAGLRETLQCFGIIGFSSQANWTASNAFVLALLQRYCDENVLTMKRIRRERPYNVLQKMAAGSYAHLIKQLGIKFIF